MFDPERHWNTFNVENERQLARKLTEKTWPLCMGFSLGKYRFLNDSKSDDGEQNYIIFKVRPGVTDLTVHYIEITTITFSKCNYIQAYDLISKIIHGNMDNMGHCEEIKPNLDTADQHAEAQCLHCSSHKPDHKVVKA